MSVLSDQDFAARIFEIAGEPVEHFEPFVFNNVEGDCIEFFVSPENYFAERIDDYLTLYLEHDTERVVGFVVKNVKRILARLSTQKAAMAFVVDDGKIRLRSLFVSMFSNEKFDAGLDRELIVREYRKVVEIAESNQLDELELACV